MGHRISLNRNRLRWAILAIAGLAILLAPLPSVQAAPVERTFRVEASRFAYTPAVLSANPGDRITIELAATDVVHGLSIDGYALEMTADPGQTQRITFTADRPGTYRFRCTATCGNLHPFMIGKLQVGQKALYWRAASLLLLAGLSVAWRLRL